VHLCTFAPCLGVSFPVHDWQFWVVTALCVLAAAWLLKGVLPIPVLSRRAKAQRRSKRVTLTVGGKAPEK
jgi:hypothetical protein